MALMSEIRKLLHDEIHAQRLSVNQALTAERHPVSVLLNNVRSAYNVGSIFRTCDAAFVREALLTGFTPFPPRKDIEKTALGATNTVPWQYFDQTDEAVEYIEYSKTRLIAVEITESARPYTDLKIADFPCCLVFGNELTGISPELLKRCHDSIEIPMYGVKHSLNVAVSVGIAVFEAVRLWKEKSKENLA